MIKLENKIPPPIILLITLIVIYLISKFDTLVNMPQKLSLAGFLIFLITGLFVCISGVLSFRKLQTTVNPLKPESATSLVTLGVFRYTRNPMYLGMLIIAFSAVVYNSSLISLIACFGFYKYINTFQIVPEERAMMNLFNDEFVEYTKSVRRWI